jgi:SAM-dependent methyltransferase
LPASERRNENLEHLTFADSSFDLVVTLDVMEHVNDPDAVIREVWRTLATDGWYVFTAPTYKTRAESERRARMVDGVIEHLAPPEFHENPTDPAGQSLVTFRYGYDLPERIAAAAPFDTTVFRFNDRRHGVLGEFTEVYACRKRTG